MTSDRDIERRLDHWFAERPTAVAERVLDEVADRIGRQPQQPAWRVSWRDSHVNTYVKPFLAAAAVVLAAAVGVTLLGPSSGPNIGGPATPSPTPPLTPSPSPTPSSTPETARMVVQGQPVSWTARVPAGWTGAGTWALTTSQGFGGPTGIGVAAPGGVNVPSDPCDGVGKVSDYKTPADVVAALEAREDLVVSNAIDTTLGGYSGKRVDVEAPADLSACTDLYIIFAEPDGSGYPVQGPSNHIRMWILDVKGRPIVFQIESFAGTPANDMAEAQQIVNSIVITP
jgi:hypothetical protein